MPSRKPIKPTTTTESPPLTTSQDSQGGASQSAADARGSGPTKFYFTVGHDIALLEEVLNVRPFAKKRGEVQDAWMAVAKTLNGLESPRFAIDGTRAYKRVFETLLPKFRLQQMDSLKSSGTEEDWDKRDSLLEELNEAVDAAEELRRVMSSEKANANAKSAALVEGLRKMARERRSEKTRVLEESQEDADRMEKSAAEEHEEPHPPEVKRRRIDVLADFIAWRKQDREAELELARQRLALEKEQLEISRQQQLSNQLLHEQLQEIKRLLLLQSQAK